MADNLEHPAGNKVSSYEEMTITKTEIKEELYDFEPSTADTEFVNVKEEPEDNIEDESFEFVKIKEQSLNENLAFGNRESREANIHNKKCTQKKTYTRNKRLSKKRVHLKNSDVSLDYKCAHCTYSNRDRLTIINHLHTHDNDSNERRFKCPYKNCKCTPRKRKNCECTTCIYAAKEKLSLQVHIIKAHSAEPKKYKCLDCKYAAHKKRNLIVHLRTHSNEKPFKCKYKKCKCTPEQKGSCICSKCGYTTARKYDLNKHIKTKHKIFLV